MLTSFKAACCPKLIKVVALNAVLLSIATIAAAQERPSSVGVRESALQRNIVPFPDAIDDMTAEDAITRSPTRQFSQDNAYQRVRDLLQSANPAIGIRCIPNDTYSHSGATAQSTADDRAITINLQGNCREIWIRVQTTDAINPSPDWHDFDRSGSSSESSWLTRTGSGWYWLTH